VKSRLDAEKFQQMLADEVRRPAARRAGAQIDARLAIKHRRELRMAVGEMQHADVAERRDAVVERRPGGQLERPRIGHRQPGGRGGGHGMEEFAAIQAENF